METQTVCKKCGSSIASDDAGGTCPRCLMGLGMNKAGFAPTLSMHGRTFSIPRVDELVGKFPNLEIEHYIGHGGMGAVYQARQLGLDRKVALKILSPQLGNDPSFTERFIREARTLGKLTHPNIVMVFEHGQTDHMNYLVMEFVDGVNLREAISEGKLTQQQALAIVPQICDALQYAHDEGVIHRDIKPENILIDRKGRVKIADFGLAKLLEPSLEEFSLTGTQQVLGTRNYMAPEQIETPDVVDHRADLYSLGVVFYELLTGELPLGRFSLPSEKAPVTHQLDDVVMRTLEKEPARRFQQASEIKSAVSSISDGPTMATATAANDYYQPNAVPEPRSTTPRLPRVSLPFSISDVYGGLAVAYGIAHVHDSVLELEFEVQDEILGSVRSGMKRVNIPLKNLISIGFVKGIFSDRIEVQSDQMELAREIPNSKQGQFKLGIKRADAERAKAFVLEAQRRANLQPSTLSPQQFQPVPSPPVKSNVARMADSQDVDNFIKPPRIGFYVIAWINLLWAVKELILAREWARVSEIANLSWLPVKIPIFVPRLEFSSVVGIAVAIWLFQISKRLRRKENYMFVFVSAIALVFVPTHPAYIVTLVFAIWTIVVLSDSNVKAAFDADHFLPRSDFGRAPQPTDSKATKLLAAILLFGIVGIGATIGLAILFLSLSYQKVHTAPAADVPVEVKAESDQTTNATNVESSLTDQVPSTSPENATNLKPTATDSINNESDLEDTTSENTATRSEKAIAEPIRDK